MWRLGHQHVEVGDRTADQLVEDRVGAFDAGGAPARLAQRVSGRA